MSRPTDLRVVWEASQRPDGKEQHLQAIREALRIASQIKEDSRRIARTTASEGGAR